MVVTVEPRMLSRELLQDRAGVVGRAVVDDDDLEGRVVESEEGLHGGFDAVGLVSRRGDDRQRRPGLRRRNVLETPQPPMADGEVDEGSGEDEGCQRGENQHGLCSCILLPRMTS